MSPASILTSTGGNAENGCVGSAAKPASLNTVVATSNNMSRRINTGDLGTAVTLLDSSPQASDRPTYCVIRLLYGRKQNDRLTSIWRKISPSSPNESDRENGD